MTGFHRRDGPLDTYSTVSCGDFHPIPFLSSKADLRTLEPQEPNFFPLYGIVGEMSKDFW